MTYPPGPQQPGQPYGQQGGYPQSGGFPEHDPYGGQVPYGQQQAQGYPQAEQYPQHGGWGSPPGPPKKPKTGLWVGLSAGAVVVIAFVVTAFLAPGFLLADDKDGKGGENGNTTASAGDPRQVAGAIVEALNNRDVPGLKSLTCAGADERVHNALAYVNQVRSAKLAGPGRQVSDTTYTASIEVTADAGTVTYDGSLARAGTTWCWQDVKARQGTPSGSTSASPPATSSAPSTPSGSADPKVILRDAVSAMNSGDTESVVDMACDSTKEDVRQRLTKLAGKSVSLEIREIQQRDLVTNGDFTGTVDGSRASGSVTVTALNSGPCVAGLSMLF